MTFTTKQTSAIRGIAAAQAAESTKGGAVRAKARKPKPDADAEDAGEMGTCPACGHEDAIAKFED